MSEHINVIRKTDSGEFEISLLGAAVTVWRARWSLIVITGVTIIFGLIGSFYFAKYESSGFFQFGGQIPLPGKNSKIAVGAPGITLSDYKRFFASFASRERFEEYVRDRKLSTAPISELRRIFISRNGIAASVEPVYPFTKLDTKILLEQSKDNSNNVIGLKIHAENADAEVAQKMVEFLGHYSMDSIIYLIYTDELRSKHSEIYANLTKLDNDIIENNQALEVFRRLGADLKAITARYPSVAHQDSRQVISITPDNARYLSPVTQLMTTEVQAAETREKIIKAKREQVQARLFDEYYIEAKKLLDNTRSGEAVLRGLPIVKEEVFKNKNLNDEVVKEVYNQITIDNQTAMSVYLENSRFIAGPTLAARSTARPALTLLASLAVGLLLSLVLIFARNWWRVNKIQWS